MAWRSPFLSRLGCGHWHRTVAALVLLGACTRPRFPINPAPAPAARPSRSDSQPKAAAEPVPLATAATLGSTEADAEYLRSRRLLLPVAGIRPDQLTDSFDEPRDGARRHRAIDILAPRGTPVLAADDGRVLRVSWNNAGGNTVYTTDSDSRVVYYYAHLDHYHEPIAAGMPLAKGDTIGFVGTTGNAPKDIPHLHFQVMRMPHDGKYWNGEPINPFSILRSEGERP
ncbi:MAG TPA: M23 family metallopeptidase [Gemmatimonadaceae bacterium]|nr:M23 family metallopeptidase [Gemmatimonadaceae bacterium]